MTARSERCVLYMTVIVLAQLFHPCTSGRRCGHGLEYGDDCSFVPAPPGRTPACAAPGYTYCEQLDHYPNDLIRHLVDKGEYDFSTLLSDETKDDFGATRPSQGPYGYGPHSLSGIQGISLVTEKPPPFMKQPQPQNHGQDQFHGNMPFNNGQYHGQGYQGQQYFGQNKGNTISPPGGYTGYYNPSHQQRPQPQPYLPSRDSYLPPKVSNSTPTSDKGNDYYRGTFPSGINLDQYDDFWRGNSYFEVPKMSPFSNSNFHRNNFGPNLEYYDNNGPSPYYSPPRDTTSSNYKAVSSGEAGWTSGDKQQQQYSYGEFVPPAVTSYNPNDWWKRQSNDHRRSSSSILPFKTVDSNDIKVRKMSKRDTVEQLQNIPKNFKHPFMDIVERDKPRRIKRQSPGTGGEQLCPTRSQFIMPKAALNKQGNWMYVVNMGETMDSSYSQLVKSEICVSQQCDGICSLPLGYTSRCEQRYVQKRLVALDQGGQRLYTDIFWFPSCCLCTISNNQT